jgi:hypothetical protein
VHWHCFVFCSSAFLTFFFLEGYMNLPGTKKGGKKPGVVVLSHHYSVGLSYSKKPFKSEFGS